MIEAAFSTGIGQMLTAVIGGVVLKMFMDYIAARREAMTSKDCEEHRQLCSMPGLRQEFMEHKAVSHQRMDHFDTRLSEICQNYKGMANDINDIKTNIAVISAWVREKK